MADHICSEHLDSYEEDGEKEVIIVTFCTICNTIQGTRILVKEIESEYD